MDEHNTAPNAVLDVVCNYINKSFDNGKRLLFCKSIDKTKGKFTSVNIADINAEANSTLLNRAICNNDIEKVKLLLKDDVDNEINSALILACYNNNSCIGKLLLEYGADPNIINVHQYGISCPLMIVCDNNNFQFAELLLKYGANINITDGDNETILFGISDINMIKFLLKNGININHTNIYGYNVFLILCKKNKIQQMKLLLNYISE